MCGINGYITKSSKYKSVSEIKNLVELMNKEILHRGPDDDGFFYDSNDVRQVALAMRRLAVIDLESGKQPIYTQIKDKVIVFNGEIYNYKDLKKNLEKEKYIFSTNSDTEVVLNLYDFYGASAFGMLDGMFALSIFDLKTNKLIVARDFFGEKPLYYYSNADKFIFASELKSIVKVIPEKLKIDKTSLNLYFQLTYIPSPFTIYEEVKKLEANHFLEIDCNTLQFEIFAIDQKFVSYDKLTKSDATNKTRDLVYESVSSRSISDVSLGTFLSGGVDSSIVSYCLSQQSSKKIDTFSIGFEKKSFDETDKSRIVAKLINSNHHEFIVGEKDLSENLSEIILNFDEPFADSSALATYLISKKTKKYVTVALTGDGGDEVFGGYNKYYMGNLNNKYTSIIPERIHQNILKLSHSLLKTADDNRGKRFKISKLLSSINYGTDFYYNIISLGFSKYELEKLFKPSYLEENALFYHKNLLNLNDMHSLSDFRKIDKILSLEGDMLVKVDRTSMLASLECRAPLLNKEIWNFTNQLPDDFLIHNWDKKHILKEAFTNNFPDGFLNKSKRGFGVPVGDWLRSELKNELVSYLDKSFLKNQDIFNIENIKLIVENHISGKQDNTFKVWSFYCFQKWYSNIYEK